MGQSVPPVQYAKNGDVHIAYEALGRGGGIDVVLIRTFVSQLEQFHRLPVMASFTGRLSELGRVICFDHRGHGSLRSRAWVSAAHDRGARR